MSSVKQLMTALLIVIGLMSTASAEVQKYEGVGVYYMENSSETFERARSEAKKKAGRAVLEQIEIYVASESELKDFNLTEDEIVTIAAGIMNVTSVRYNVNSYDKNLFAVECILTATVDTDRIGEMVERERQARFGRR